MSKGYVVGVDSGTQGAKVVVTDAAGNIVSEGATVHAPMFALSPGWAEQHPEDNWVKFCQACQQAMANLPVPKSELAAIGITGQRGTTALLDEEGNPFRPFVVWLDPRMGTWPQWVRENEPESYEKTYKISSVQGWLVKQLTGVFADCVAYPPAGPGSVNALLAWPDDPAEFEAWGMPREKVMDIVPPGTVYGPLTRVAAEATGLPEGLPVVAAAGDKQCEVLGAGAIAPGQAYVTYGTLSSICTTVYDQPIFAKAGEYYTLGAAVPGAWGPETSVRGHWMVTWFKEEFGRDAIEEAKTRGISAEQILNEEMVTGEVPPGSHGLLVYPYWDARPYAPQASGVILGFYDAVHKRPHVFRAILEGIAYALRGALEVYGRDSGVPITDVWVGGGGSKSDIGMQATADIFNMSCKRPHTPETCALGGAISAAVGAGLYSDFHEAAAAMTRSIGVFEPIPKNVAMYDAVYNRVFTKLYAALEEVFTNLNDIRELPKYEGG